MRGTGVSQKNRDDRNQNAKTEQVNQDSEENNEQRIVRESRLHSLLYYGVVGNANLGGADMSFLKRSKTVGWEGSNPEAAIAVSTIPLR